jgi:hypothetical protein
MDLHGLLRAELYFLYVDEVRTSQEIYLRASTDCYGDSFALLYIIIIPQSSPLVANRSVLGVSRRCGQICSLLVTHATGNVRKGVRFAVFTVVTMKNGIFWDVTPCGYCKNRLHHKGDKNR